MPAAASKLRVLLIGSTGPLGRAVIEHSDPVALSIRAFARSPEALAGQAEDAVAGDVRDRESLLNALRGMDAVVCSLGAKPWQRDARGVHETGTRNLLSAMGEAGVSRLIAVTGVGAGSSRGHGPIHYNLIARPLILRSVYADKERQEALITNSQLDWTIVRPGILVPRTPAKPIQANAMLGAKEKMGAISRDDVARFLIGEVLHPEHVGEIVHLYT